MIGGAAWTLVVVVALVGCSGQPSGPPDTNALSGLWERSSSNYDGRMIGTSGYARASYDLRPDGSYSFHAERSYGQSSANEWHLVDEQGTYSVSGDQVTIAPASAKGVVKDGDGNVVKEVPVELEKVTYGWKKILFEGLNETQLVLTAAHETIRDGGFASNDAFPNAYLFSPGRKLEWKF